MQEQDLLKQIGLSIKNIRIKKEISQTALAYLCDFEKASMSRIESGRTNPSIKTLYKISKALDVKLLELFE
jgi:transcriptional regulator with XRE-family HTH domain